jgi:acetyltransferase-like isoleucine patch superfamily enzyme
MKNDPINFRDGMTKWHWFCQHHDNLHLGKNVDIGAFTYLNALNHIHIGDNVQIGSHCSLYTVSNIDNKYGEIVIESGARIGTHSTVMPGITIGKNALICAYSFVNRDVEKDEVVCGVPIRRR